MTFDGLRRRDRLVLSAARDAGVPVAIVCAGGYARRVEDTAARLGPEVFALALPATSLQNARSAGERIAAVIGCTAFDAGDGNIPFVVEFDLGVAEVTSPETVGRALEEAAAQAQGRKAS